MKIIKITEYHPDFLAAVNHLLSQLSADATPLTENSLTKILASGDVNLLMAIHHNQPVGMLSLVTFKTPTGNRARIEDLVVDANARRHGVAGRLVNSAITLAKNSGAATIELTSHPSREPANALYRKTGFEIRETNVYQYR